MTRLFTDRSRIETFQRCPRRRYLNYAEAGTGIESVKKSLPLAVGASVHVGLAVLLDCARILQSRYDSAEEMFANGTTAAWESDAVRIALADFSQYHKAIELDTNERPPAAITPASDDPELAAMTQQAAGDYDEYLYREQAALVEGLVRAYARRRLRPLLEGFEVLEVEREGMWRLAYWENGKDVTIGFTGAKMNGKTVSGSITGPDYDELWFMSRPDALLRERQTNQLYLLSYKTTGGWDTRRAKDAEHDMQGLSEGIEVERRLAGWWETLKNHPGKPHKAANGDALIYTENQGVERMTVMPWNMVDYLRSCSTAPRIHAIRYEFLLKGERWVDKDLSARYGFDARAQRSHLIRRYLCTSTPRSGPKSYSVGDACWSWEFHTAEGATGKLAWQNWKSAPVWESPGGVRAWIDLLDQTTEAMSGEDSTVGMEPRSLGWHGPAQALGFTGEHPLDAAFLAPMVVYRQEDDLRDLVEQIEAQECRVAEWTAEVNAAADPGEKRSLLNRYFGQNRNSCYYPTECAFTRVCYGGEDIRRSPLESGFYARRVPNHAPEREAR